MTVHQLPTGTWQARWRDNDGRNRSKTFKRKRDAAAYLRDTLTDLGRGVYLDPRIGKLTVAEMADEWLDTAMNLGQGGRDTYRRDLDRHILPKLGKLPLNRLTKERIDRFLVDELEADIAASTVHRHYRTIRRLAQVAIDQGRLQVNPCGNVTPPRVTHTEMRFLTVAQVDALADKIGPRYKAWVYVACYGGLRWSETVGLRRSRIDGARVTVAEQLIRRADGVWARDQPKTAAGRRVVSVPDFVADELVTHLAKYSGAGPDGLVFPNRNGDPMVSQSFTGNVFKPALKKAGIDPKVRVHDLRHTAVALLIAVGAHPKAIQVRLGHTSITTTLDRYGHLMPEADETIAGKLGELRPNG